uniref:Uncharacterized protein n=1 Tax=Ananas comosus var. bracteatus TaxID=296719 RepID=A0A6V7PY19_ANACO|nr:unnamed protein product [Ananas comosus var. bracteatus]
MSKKTKTTTAATEATTSKVPQENQEASPLGPTQHHHHQPTPLHPSSKKPPKPTLLRLRLRLRFRRLCLRLLLRLPPSSRDKPSVVPLDPSFFPLPLPLPHPQTSPLSRRTTPLAPPPPPPPPPPPAEEWRLAAAELSRKLLAATRKRDEALLEASRLKYSLSELQSQLSSSIPLPPPLPTLPPLRLPLPLLHPPPRPLPLLPPPNPNPNPNPNLLLLPTTWSPSSTASSSPASSSTTRTRRGSPTRSPLRLQPAAYEAVHALTWDQVLNKGTKHYSEGLSRFCDRKMSDVVGSVGSNRPGPEPLLQAFFSAAKAAFTVRLMARSVHPTVPIIRVDRGLDSTPGSWRMQIRAGRAGSGRARQC